MLNYLLASLLLTSGAIASFLLRKLTASASILGASIGVLLFIGFGWMGITLMAAFFVLGTLATSWKRRSKETLGIAEEDKGRRKWTQVFANAGGSAIAAMLSILYPDHNMLISLMMCAGFSSATADTLSSELGSVYGKRFYNILSFKKDRRGLNGVISLEGTLFGLAGSMLIALIALCWFGWKTNTFLIIITAGTAGNLFDSFLGAAFERKDLIKNDAVNFLNTAFAAAAAYILYLFV
ncbi:MAG: DUF92 domain-containing protein [Chitinophagaceae bacterium]